MNGEISQEYLAGSASFSCIERPSWFGSYDDALAPAQMRAQHVAFMAYFLADGNAKGKAFALPDPSTPQPPPS